MQPEKKLEMIQKILDVYIKDYDVKIKESRSDKKMSLADKYWDRYAQLMWVKQLITDDESLNYVYQININDKEGV